MFRHFVDNLVTVEATSKQLTVLLKPYSDIF